MRLQSGRKICTIWSHVFTLPKLRFCTQIECMERNLEEPTTKWLEAWTWAGRLIPMVSEGVSATLSHLNYYRENELKCWLKTNNTVLSSWEKVAMEPFPHSAPDSNWTCQAFLRHRAFALTVPSAWKPFLGVSQGLCKCSLLRGRECGPVRTLCSLAVRSTAAIIIFTLGLLSCFPSVSSY